MENNKFDIILLGMIYNPRRKQILIGKGNLDPFSKTGWCFPGAKLKNNEELDKKLKEIINKVGNKAKEQGMKFDIIEK